MGGGVGGMVYSIRKNASDEDEIKCSHANHRGDIIARTDHTGSLTSFALYEAYGTRPYEWGDDPDRQKANTKEEETDLNLLNEGMRFRDLETGTFLTRDPIGYADGPNVYCYVHCNPITHFDALGLDLMGIDGNSLPIPEPEEPPSDDLSGSASSASTTAESVDLYTPSPYIEDLGVTVPDNQPSAWDQFYNRFKNDQEISRQAWLSLPLQ